MIDKGIVKAMRRKLEEMERLLELIESESQRSRQLECGDNVRCGNCGAKMERTDYYCSVCGCEVTRP